MTDPQAIADGLSEAVCANCKGMFDDLEPGRDPEELCPCCWEAAQENLRAILAKEEK